MSKKSLTVGLFLAASPLLAQAPAADALKGAPQAGPSAKYCMRVSAVEGSLVEVVRCWTREQWSQQGVDVDKEWAKEGVSVREDGSSRP